MRAYVQVPESKRKGMYVRLHSTMTSISLTQLRRSALDFNCTEGWFEKIISKVYSKCTHFTSVSTLFKRLSSRVSWREASYLLRDIRSLPEFLTAYIYVFTAVDIRKQYELQIQIFLHPCLWESDNCNDEFPVSILLSRLSSRVTVNHLQSSIKATEQCRWETFFYPRGTTEHDFQVPHSVSLLFVFFQCNRTFL